VINSSGNCQFTSWRFKRW